MFSNGAFQYLDLFLNRDVVLFGVGLLILVASLIVGKILKNSQNTKAKIIDAFAGIIGVLIMIISMAHGVGLIPFSKGYVVSEAVAEKGIDFDQIEFVIEGTSIYSGGTEIDRTKVKDYIDSVYKDGTVFVIYDNYSEKETYSIVEDYLKDNHYPVEEKVYEGDYGHE